MAATPVKVDCDHCGNVWQTAAEYGSVARCPACGKSRRIRLADRPQNGTDAAGAPVWGTDADGPPADAQSPLCPECGEPAQWAGARTRLSCSACGYSGSSAYAAGRAADLAASQRRERREASTAEVEPATDYREEFTTLYQIKAYQQRLIDLENDFAAYRMPNGYENVSSDALAQIAAMRQQANRIGTMAELFAVQNAHQQIVTQLDNRARQLHQVAQYNGTYQERPAIESRRVITGTVEHDDSDEPAEPADTVDGQYWENDEKEKDYTRYEHDGPGLFSLLGYRQTWYVIGGIVALVIAYNKYQDYLDVEVPRNCESGRHRFAAPVATQAFAGQMYGQYYDRVHVCDKDKCVAWVQERHTSAGYQNSGRDPNGPFAITRRDRRDERRAAREAANGNASEA
jgi:predicted RNA-binding Zn-ribbon protein involved in translation (DUF1610 family)